MQDKRKLNINQTDIRMHNLFVINLLLNES